MRFRSGLLVLAAMVALPAASAGATIVPVITGIPVTSSPDDVALDAEGNVWFADGSDDGALGRITPAGISTTFTAGLVKDSAPRALTAGPGGMWFAGKTKLGRIAADGTITQFDLATGMKAEDVAAGADGNLWMTAKQPGAEMIVRVTPTGTVSSFSAGLPADADPSAIASGPDGALYFTMPELGKFGRITTDGAITVLAYTALPYSLQDITAGPDGALWFTQNGLQPAIGRLSLGGSVTRWSAGLPFGSAPRAIASAPNGVLSFTDPGANAIGQITTSGVISVHRAGISPIAGLAGIAAGAGDAVWFAESNTGRVGRLGPPAVAAPPLPGAPEAPAAPATQTAPPLADSRNASDDDDDNDNDDQGEERKAKAEQRGDVKAEPTLGRSAVASVTGGSVRVRTPGSTTSVPLEGGQSIPSGSIIDSRDGTVALESALDAEGRTQTARFRGARFRMELSRRLVGTVDIKLTDGPVGCTARRTATVRAARRAKAPVKLWSSDKKGKYRTHGRNSVAVVRGTEWTTEETCAGTRTRVIRGAVSVWDRRTGRKILVRANRSHLARPKR